MMKMKTFMRDPGQGKEKSTLWGRSLSLLMVEGSVSETGLAAARPALQERESRPPQGLSCQEMICIFMI